jgi:hypothetical protein
VTAGFTAIGLEGLPDAREELGFRFVGRTFGELVQGLDHGLAIANFGERPRRVPESPVLAAVGLLAELIPHEVRRLPRCAVRRPGVRPQL